MVGAEGEEGEKVVGRILEEVGRLAGFLYSVAATCVILHSFFGEVGGREGDEKKCMCGGGG